MVSDETILRIVMPIAKELLERQLALGRPVDVRAIATEALLEVARVIRLDGHLEKLTTLLASALQEQLSPTTASGAERLGDLE